MRGIIIYQGKYGTTEQYANWLANSLHLTCMKAVDVTPNILAGYELIILGSSVYVGKLLIAKWLRRNHSLLAGKKLFIFIVCGMTAEDTMQQQQVVDKNLDPAIRSTTSVFLLPGRCIISRLSLTDRFIIKMGARRVDDPAKKASMTQGYDRMNKNNLTGLIAAARRELKQKQTVAVQ